VPITRRLLTTAVAGVLTAAGLTIPTTAALASPAPALPTLTVTDSANAAAAGVSPGDPLTVTATTPITQSGQTAQSIQTTWDAAKASADLSSLVTPEGWTTSYTTDGTTWSASVPSDPATVSGVKASGNVASEGVSGALQVSKAVGSGTVIRGAAVFSGTSGGDGWDAFDAGPNVLNIWHHNSDSYNLDCHSKIDGTPCADGVYTVWGYQTSGASTGSYVDGKVYSMTVENQSAQLGVLCTDVSALPFTPCGFTPLTDNVGYYQAIGSQTMVDGRVYASTEVNGGLLLCYDIASAAPCANQPYPASGLYRTGEESGYAINVGGKVFITANQVWCFDAATGAACAGSWPVGSLDYPEQSVTPMRSSTGTLTGVCTIRANELCWDLNGDSVAYPQGLADQIATYPVGGLDGYSQFTFNGTRAYWFVGDWYGTSPVACYDWLTSAACAGFDSSTGIAAYRYALRFDSTNPNCLWSNGDNGQLASIDANTGAAGCTDPSPKVMIPYSNVVPRLSCAEVGRVREWRNVTLTAPAGITVTTLKLTVNNANGFAVPGFVDLQPSAAGVVNLSSLSVADSGTQPSFVVTVPGATDTQAADLTASVRYASDPPQLCLNLSVQHSCPVLSPGLSAGPDVAVPALAISGEAVATSGGVDTATPLSSSVTEADLAGCVGALSGSANRTFPGGSVPIGNTSLDLLDDGGNTVASTTTAGDGSYSFANVNPAAYNVRVAGTQRPVTVVAAGSATASVNVPVTSPVAADVSSTTLQNRATTFAVSATTDPTTSVDRSQVKLLDPTTTVYGSSVTVAGEGTWTVTSGGDLVFTPVAAFSGVTTPVTYQVADLYGTTATAHAVVTVSAVLPTAAAISATGVQGDTLTLTPVTASAAVGVDAASLRLVDPATHAAVSTLVVDGVGTYTADPATGKISFVPVGTFSGSNSQVYRVLDTLGRSVTSTLTVTLSPFTMSTATSTVASGGTSSTTLTGVPDGAVVTVPATVTGAASVTVSGTTVTVVPSPRFSGVITVPVTVVHGATTITTTVLVMVRPQGVTAGWHTLTKAGRSLVHWTASPSAARYQVKVNGKVLCTTTQTHCVLSGLLGPKSVVTVTSVGGANLRSTDRKLPYRFTLCVTAGAVHFDTGSSVLTGANQSKVARFAAVLKAQGFTHACLSGYTDSRSSAAFNKALSHARVKAVGAALSAKLRKTHSQRVGMRTAYLGEYFPAATNNSDKGRAENRRVSLALG
jgi:CshA-type fibril repeat protein